MLDDAFVVKVHHVRTQCCCAGVTKDCVDGEEDKLSSMHNYTAFILPCMVDSPGNFQQQWQVHKVNGPQQKWIIPQALNVQLDENEVGCCVVLREKRDQLEIDEIDLQDQLCICLFPGVANKQIQRSTILT